MSDISKQPVKFIACTNTQYRALDNKENNAIYFVAEENNNRLYVGSTCYNINIVQNFNVVNDTTVPSSLAVSTALNNKLSRPTIETITDTTLPATLILQTDHEYRYINLSYSSDTPPIILSIPESATDYFYASIILKGINRSTSTPIGDFVTLASGTGLLNSIIFLNDVDLDGKDVVEILLFSNGVDVCCIATAYITPIPPTP